MKILICEDNKIMLDIIHKTVADYTMIHDWDNVTIFPINTATETLEIINSEKIDFFFLDIDLGNNEINGIELGRKIRDIDPFAKLIYITSHDNMQNIILQKMISPFAYILKNKDSLEQEIRSVLEAVYNQYKKEIITNPNTNKIPIKIGTRQLFFHIDDILYFETFGNHKISIVLKDNKNYSFYGKLSEIAQLNKKLIYCHKSYIMNIDNILEIEKDKIVFTNNIELLLSENSIRKIKKTIKENFNN